MTRKTFLLAAAAAASPLGAVPRTQMGIAATSYLTVRRPRDTYEFLEYCHSLGAGGIQANLTSLDAGYLKTLRERAEQYGMYLEVMASLPKEDTSAFEAVVKAAKETGALCLRAACLSGRRYETFETLADWQKFITDSISAIARALPIVEKYRLPLALENHKDWTLEELRSIVTDKKSEYLGVCLDTGNNIALLDDPMEFVEALAPFAISTHLKDMGVQSYRDGFLLSELPFGEGFLDIKRIVSTIRKARPQTRITLEMITRNPLEVPCLTDKYWVTFQQRNGKYLARTLRMLLANTKLHDLPRLDHLDQGAQLRLEEDNVKQCLHYARNQLSL